MVLQCTLFWVIIYCKEAEEMLSVTDPDNKELLEKLVGAMYDELPAGRKGKR